MPQLSLSSWLLPRKAASAVGTAPPTSENTVEAPIEIASNLPVTAQSWPEHNATLRLPPKAALEPLSDDFMIPFQRLNALLLPIPYQNSFYMETKHDPVVASLTRIITWKADKSRTAEGKPDRQLVAAIRCRLVPTNPDEPRSGGESLYISTIGILAPYRGHGLAQQLLHDVMRTAATQYGVSRVVAHVWEANEDALEWYQKRGFKTVRKEKGYYRRLAPKTDAWFIQKDIQPLDVLRGPQDAH